MRSPSISPSVESSSFRRSLRKKNWEEKSRDSSISQQGTNNFIEYKARKKLPTTNFKSEKNEASSPSKSIDILNKSIGSSSGSAIASTGTLGNDSEDQYWESIENPEAIVRVTIDDEKISLKLQNILQREREMRLLAAEQGIDRKRWDGSLLYRKVCKASIKKQVDFKGNFNILISNEESDEAETNKMESNSSEKKNSIPRWTHLVQQVLSTYYSFGRIPVPDNSTGPDILHMLESFALVYSPALLDFQSYGAYVRVRLWGEYFFHRVSIFDWIAKQLFSSSTPRKSIYFVTSPENVSDLGMYYVLKGTDTRCELFNSGLIIHDELETKMGSVDDENETSCSLIHEFFNSDDTEENEGSVDARLREDFQFFLQSCLVGSHVSFDMREIELVSSNSYTNAKGDTKKMNRINVIGKRAILHISLMGSSIGKNNTNEEVVKAIGSQIEIDQNEKSTAIKIPSKKKSKGKKCKPRRKHRHDIPEVTVNKDSSTNVSLASTLTGTYDGRNKKSSGSSENDAIDIVSPNASCDAITSNKSFEDMHSRGVERVVSNFQNSHFERDESSSSSNICRKTDRNSIEKSFDSNGPVHRCTSLKNDCNVSCAPDSPSHSLGSSSDTSGKLRGCNGSPNHFTCGVDEVNASWLWTVLNSICFGHVESESLSDKEFNNAFTLTNFGTLSKSRSLENLKNQTGKPPLYPFQSNTK